LTALDSLLDLPPHWIREARRRRIPFVISTDAHSVGELDNLRWGIDGPPRVAHAR
jgi:histidinol phosphatase-like PHP family hydrolase